MWQIPTTLARASCMISLLSEGGHHAQGPTQEGAPATVARPQTFKLRRNACVRSNTAASVRSSAELPLACEDASLRESVSAAAPTAIRHERQIMVARLNM